MEGLQCVGGAAHSCTLPSSVQVSVHQSSFAAWDLGDVVSHFQRANTTRGDRAQSTEPVSPHAGDYHSAPADFLLCTFMALL